jgi:hypothetical protein
MKSSKKLKFTIQHPKTPPQKTPNKLPHPLTKQLKKNPIRPRKIFITKYV